MSITGNEKEGLDFLIPVQVHSSFQGHDMG